jgi:hypothetical protein
MSSEISSPNGGEYENDSLLGCYTVLSHISWPTFQRFVLPVSIALMMEALRTSETSVIFYETTRCNIPECCYLETDVKLCLSFRPVVVLSAVWDYSVEYTFSELADMHLIGEMLGNTLGARQRYAELYLNWRVPSTRIFISVDRRSRETGILRPRCVGRTAKECWHISNVKTFLTPWRMSTE